MDSDKLILKILERVPSPAVIASPVTGKVLWVNERLAGMYGVADPHALIGRTLFDFINASQLSRALADLAKVAAGQSPPPVTYQLKRANGELAAGRVSSVPMMFQKQPAMLSFVTDVSEHERLARELSESEARYRALLESMPCGVTVVSEDEMIVYANATVARSLGYDSADDLIGKMLAAHVHPEDMVEIRKARRLAMQEQRPFGGWTVRLIKVDGETLETPTSSTVMRWEGEPVVLTLLYDLLPSDLFA